MKRFNLKIFKVFVQSESVGGIILLVCVVASLIIANSGAGPAFEQLLSTSFGYENLHLQYSLLEWINDGLMAVFFLLVGLEIKRALVEGELSSVKRASLPVFAAIGGAVAPAFIFWMINKGTDTANGWGIPMATDIAFAMAIISLLGSRVPASLKIFLASLAIVDDLIAILVIAIFYSGGLEYTYLLLAAAMFIIMIAFNRFGVKRLIFYIIPGLFLWYFVHLSGVHATIAGVLMAFSIPTNKEEVESPLEKLEHMLTKPVNFLIMPLFALANTNIAFQSEMISGLYSPMSIGIIAALLFGKPLGIGLVSWTVVKLGVGALPRKITWRHVIGVGILGGVGFTMSIFITLLSYKDSSLHADAKLAIVVASVIAGIVGFFFLKYSRSKTSLKSINNKSSKPDLQAGKRD